MIYSASSIIAAIDAVDQPTHTTSTERAAAAGQKIVNLALQGGGSHGAFTWGVLDRLLEEERLEFEGITGTSAGAVNAVVLADGLAAGGREGAREALRIYWQKVSELSARGPLAPSVIDIANPDHGLEHSPGFIFLEPLTYFASPYQINPFNYQSVQGPAGGVDQLRARPPANRLQTVSVRDQCPDRQGEDLQRQGHWRRARARVDLPAAVDAGGRGRRRILLGRQLRRQSGDLSAGLRMQTPRHPHGPHHAGGAAGRADHLAGDHESHAGDQLQYRADSGNARRSLFSTG